MLLRLCWLTVVIMVLSLPARADGLTEKMSVLLTIGVNAAATEEEAAALAVLEPYYRGREMTPLWLAGGTVNESGRQLSDILNGIDGDGLNPADYGARAIAALLPAGEPDKLAELEIRLSLALMQLASDLGGGQTAPHVADPKMYPFREKVDKAEVIARAGATTAITALVDGYRPQTPRYDRAKAALAAYRTLAANGGWEKIPDGPTLKPGMSDPRIGLLRARLKLWGDLKAEDDAAMKGGDGNLYDDAMVKAVKWMQYRHGLAQDGAVGKKSLKLINVPAEKRVEQLILNLERRRWMPDYLGQRYIFVNLADFLLKLVDEPKTLLDMRVVVGKTYHKTPVFSKEMTYLVINPFWNVPPSIARAEILPQIKKDPGYLARKNFTLFAGWGEGAAVVDPTSVDWSTITRRNFPYRIRQGSGDGNALGRIKFMLPNKFNIYLHDTPSKSGFTLAVRSFSHGCVRVHDPVKLATFVLNGKRGWDREKIEKAIASGERRVVTLGQLSLPVHISYLTAWVNKDGSVHFRDDIYKRDVVLAKALLEN